MPLNANAGQWDRDEIYAALIAAHDGVSELESQQFNARLILLLANHVGDTTVVHEALRLAARAAAHASAKP